MAAPAAMAAMATAVPALLRVLVNKVQTPEIGAS
jgi:hypothetical protein